MPSAVAKSAKKGRRVIAQCRTESDETENYVYAIALRGPA